jgi:hypothetical protein
MVEYELQVQLNRIETKLDAMIMELCPKLIKQPEEDKQGGKRK